MTVEYVPLRWLPDGGWAALRELCGADEAAIGDSRTRDAVGLLDRLLVAAADTRLHPGQAAVLCAAERDQLLAVVYQRIYGPSVKSTLRCKSCERLFDLEFSLADLVATLAPEPVPAAHSSHVELLGDGTYRLSDGRRFRLPTAADEFAISGLPFEAAERALLARCLTEGDPDADPVTIQETMALVAPVVDLDLEARCPECDTTQLVHFDIQSYLLGRMVLERPQLLAEVHRLALAYHWSHAEILGLPRRERRAYIDLIMAEADRRIR